MAEDASLMMIVISNSSVSLDSFLENECNYFDNQDEQEYQIGKKMPMDSWLDFETSAINYEYASQWFEYFRA